LKYLFEEVPDKNRDPKKFLGYLDESFNSGGNDRNATYAIMIYDVRCHITIIKLISKRFEKLINFYFRPKIMYSKSHL